MTDRSESVDPHRSERDSEAIAEVIADIGAGRALPAKGNRDIYDAVLGMWNKPVVIDATPIYHQALGKPEIAYYEDHPCIAPPFDQFAMCYRNDHGNVVVMHTVVDDGGDWELNEWLDPSLGPGDQWATAQTVDWDRVRWRMLVTLWLGGRGGEGPVPSMGPFYAWKIAVYDDGEPADITWVDMGEQRGVRKGPGQWDMATATMLEALYYLNCRNIEVVEPKRSRGFARRMQRLGVKVGQIRVFPVGKTTRSRDRGEGMPVGGDNPASAVRGHFATYGMDGKGLLFGKYKGRFWIPDHFRGNRELGENENSYVLEGR